MHGSIQLVQSLLDVNLLDELRVIAAPAAGAPGRRLFEDLSALKRYRLVSVSPTTTGNLLLTYGKQ